MFTVKVCEGPTDETVFEATKVRKMLTEGTAPDIGQVLIDAPDGGQLSYPIFNEQVDRQTRTIYVMNRFGATVATYRI